MSENITHTAVCDDAHRLAPHLNLPGPLRAAWDDHPDVARLGGITRQADTFSADLVLHAAVEAKQPDGDRDAPRKLAFVLGALTHRSIDRHMKPVFRYFSPKTRGGSDEAGIDARRRHPTDPVNYCTIYCDVFILAEVYGRGIGPHAGPYPPRLLDGPAGAARAGLEEAFRAVWQRTLIRMHTFKPDVTDIHAWLSRLFAARQDFDLDIKLYEQVALEWNPASVKKYLEEPNFYGRADPLIAVARSIQHGSAMGDADVQDALDATTGASSLYARALKRACHYLRAAGRLYEGSMSREDARREMDIGVPELAMGYEPPAGRGAGGVPPAS